MPPLYLNPLTKLPSRLILLNLSCFVTGTIIICKHLSQYIIIFIIFNYCNGTQIGGHLDFIFGKAPEWEEVSKDTFSTEDTYIYSKGESKQLFKLYLNRLGFSKEGIRDEVDLYTKSMQDDEEFIKESDGWKPYLIKYVNDRVESEADAKKR